MKRLISIVLIISITAPFGISYSIFQFQKYTVRKEVKKQLVSKINKDNLVLIKLSKKEADEKLEWEHSREFEYLGTMYDVIDGETRNDSVFYWCWEDNEETKLNIKLNALLEKTAAPDQINNENLKQLSNFLSTLFYSHENPFDISRNKDRATFSSCYLNFYSTLPTDPQTPPPKIVFC